MPLRRLLSIPYLFRTFACAGAVACLAASGCSDDEAQQVAEVCVLAPGQSADFLEQLGCSADFAALSSQPLDSSLPGARAVKTIIDRSDLDHVYFQNSQTYAIHWEFAQAHLSGNGKEIVGTLADFNRSEYYSPQRRFVLGSLTYYEGPKKWTWELSPYDTANAEMIAAAYNSIAAKFIPGQELLFHPTSEAIEAVAKTLPATIKQISTKELYDGIDFQPLNLGESVGRLRMMSAAELESQFVGFRDIVVLDAVPNDISVVQGIITEQFQTPLSHINVLSQNRGTPNMGLRGAMSNPELLALNGQWVRLTVDAFGYKVAQVDQATADAWWEANKPTPLGVPALDLEEHELRDCTTMIDTSVLDLKSAIRAKIPAYGGKASHFAALTAVAKANAPDGFGIPVAYYWQFMEENGFFTQVDAMLADPLFQSDPAVRDAKLHDLREAMKVAPINAEFQAALTTKLTEKFGNLPIRFRSSTNGEDLEGFTGAGLYTSKTGSLNDPNDTVWDAIRTVWASVWYFRAFEERAYRSIDHKALGMALLVHRSFPDEEANGVALTANPFDTSGGEPGFYVNVQVGEASVVQPDAGVSTDQFILHWEFQGQPAVFLAHSNLVAEGSSVLTHTQMLELGGALAAIHEYFAQAYKPDPATGKTWYAMDVEFKFDQPPEGGELQLYVKQARPHPGWGSASSSGY